MLELQNITKIYHPGSATEHRLFEGFSLTVPDGQFVSIVGSNGSGKTSLLNILCGSIGVEGGDVLVDGEFMEEKKNLRLRFRGSENQRLIDLRKTEAAGSIVTWTDRKEGETPCRQYL